MFKSLGIRGKLLGIFALLSLVSVAVGVTGITTLNRVTTNYDHIINVNLANIKNTKDMLSYYRRSYAALAMLATPEISEADALKKIEMSTDALAVYDAAKKDYLSVPFESKEEEEMFKKLDVTYNEYVKIKEDVVKAYKEKDRKTLVKLLIDDLGKNNTQQREEANALMEYHNEAAKTSIKAAHDEADFGDRLSIGTILVGFVLTMGIGFFFARSLAKTLLDVAASLSHGADDVASASTEIASSSEELSASVTEQAAALQETAASIEEMSAMVAKNTENCTKSKGISDRSQESANEGKHIVEQMIQSIQEIDQSNQQMTTEIEANNREISDIIKVISEIGNKTKVINDIVFQTKLLSFNASVEAARAGEHGKGFAVVAEEVGNLAQMSGNSAKEISSMLEESMVKVETIVNNTKAKVERLVSEGKQKVEKGSEIAKRCGEVLDGIVSNVTTANEVVAEIDSASKEQDHGIKEVSKAMGQLDQATQQNSAATQQTASAAQQLSSQAETLRANVQTLVRTVSGANAGNSNFSTTSSATQNRHTPSEFRKKKPEQPSKGAQVVQLKRPTQPVLKATGTDGIPSEDDPRFKDV